MSLRKRNNIWHIDIRLPDGSRIRKSTKTENKKLATKIHAKASGDSVEGKWFDNFDIRRTLKEMLDRYEREYTDYKDYYQKARDKSIFTHLYAHFGEDATLGEVDKRIGSYELHRRNGKKRAAAGTIIKELGLLRSIFNIARRQWKWKISNPVSDIKLPKAKNERVRYLKPEELKRLLRKLEKVPEPWLKPMVIVSISTGLRLQNAIDMTWDDVDLPSRIITLQAELTKNNDYLGVPIPKDALHELKILRRSARSSRFIFHDHGEKLYPVKVQRALKRLLKKAKITNFHWHDFKHCYCSYLRQAGVDLHTIAQTSNHRDMRSVKRYSHLNVDNLRDAASHLDSVTKWSQKKRAKTGRRNR